MSDQGFLEVETPILGRSTPEGARDFLVPSRVHAGHFYALPQSPQLYKQLLMVVGLRPLLPDRPLLPRRGPPRQPPARVHPARRRDVVRRGPGRHDGDGAARRGAREGVHRRGRSTLPLPRLDYHDAMERFGNDRPDLRYGMELKDVADLAAETEFKVFQHAATNGHRIRGLCAPGGGEKYSRKDLDGLTEFAADVRRQGAGLAQGRGRGPDRPDRQVLPARRPGQAPRAVRRQAGRPDPDRRRHPGRDQPGALEPPHRGWRPS